MIHTHLTDPMPVFPTAGAQPWTTRTPMGLEVEAATAAAIMLAGARHLSLHADQVHDIVTATIGDYLDDYGRLLEKAAMEATAEHEGLGLIAVWHGASYSIGLTDRVPPGYLVEERCYCGNRPAEIN